MISLEQLERDLHERGALETIDHAYAHRALRETPRGLLHGRASLKHAALKRIAKPAVLSGIQTVGHMVSAEFSNGLRSHRWVYDEDARIVREIEIVSGQDACVLPAVPPPLGELSSGQGQLAPGAVALVPKSLPHTPLLNLLHRFWNGRALNLAEALSFTPDLRDIAMTLLQALPDAHWMIEDVAQSDTQTAVLWRLYGHDVADGLSGPASGKRIRILGSSLFKTDKDAVHAHALVIDWPATLAQCSQVIISL